MLSYQITFLDNKIQPLKVEVMKLQVINKYQALINRLFSVQSVIKPF